MKFLLWLTPALLVAQTEWSVPPEFRAAGYVKEKRDRGWALTGPGPNGAMTGILDAAPFRGAPVRMRASVRVEGQGSAQLMLRVDRPSGLGFFDNMADRPIRGQDWQAYELTAEVASDATTIEVGVLSTGTAAVHVDGVSFEKLPPLSAAAAAARQAILQNYARVDAAYAEGDVDAIASLAMADAQVVLSGVRTKLSTILTQIMDQVSRGTKLRSRSTVTAFRLLGTEATVWVNNESSGDLAGVFSANRDIWVNTPAGWRLKESALIATRLLTPPEVLTQIRERSGIPDWKDVRIILWHAGNAPALPGFTATRVVSNQESAMTAVAWLKEHAPEEAGPAELAFLSNDSSRVAAVMKVFDAHRASTSEWAWARQATAIAHQALTLRDRPDEAAASQVIWLASDPYRNEKIVVSSVPPGAVPFVRARYGKQVYSVGVVARELLGGEHFVDIANVPRDSALGRWLATQKFPYDAIAGR